MVFFHLFVYLFSSMCVFFRLNPCYSHCDTVGKKRREDHGERKELCVSSSLW